MTISTNDWNSYYSHLQELAPKKWQRQAAGANNELAESLFAEFYGTRNFIPYIDCAKNIVDHWLAEMED